MGWVGELASFSTKLGSAELAMDAAALGELQAARRDVVRAKLDSVDPTRPSYPVRAELAAHTERTG